MRIVEITARKCRIWKCGLQRLHQAEFVIALHDSGFQKRADLSDLQHHTLIEPTVLGRHTDVDYGNGNSIIADHDVEQLKERPRRAFERRIAQHVGVVRTNFAEEFAASKENRKMLGPTLVLLFKSDTPVTNILDLFEAIFRLHVVFNRFPAKIINFI